LCALAAPAHAQQQYPAKPIRLIVPYPPGGTTDIVAREVGNRIGEGLGTQFLIDNRPGAGTFIGLTLGAKAPPDGYTLTFGTSAGLAVNPALGVKMPFDPQKDFVPIGVITFSPFFLVVHPSLPVKNVKELVALAKAKPATLTYASTGNGTSPHMLMEMFKWMAGGINLVHVPYKGASPAMIDQISGQIDVAFSTAIAALPFVQQGKVRAIAVSTKDRFAPLPDLPTVEQGGIKGYDGSSWQGVVMPANTPRDMIAKANAELVKMLKSPDMKEKILLQGGIAIGNSPDEFAAYMKSEIDKWAKVAKAANVRVE
jgi:tripartite-type tricarboxylate transporter receptor subunit TctC